MTRFAFPTFLLFGALLTAPLPAASQVETICGNFGQIAEGIMRLRQEGTPMSEQMGNAAIMAQGNPDLEKVFRGMAMCEMQGVRIPRRYFVGRVFGLRFVVTVADDDRQVEISLTSVDPTKRPRRDQEEDFWRLLGGSPEAAPTIISEGRGKHWVIGGRRGAY
jgi:hypothetical protein